jgi:hypothetical protein
VIILQYQLSTKSRNRKHLALFGAAARDDQGSIAIGHLQAILEGLG